LELGIRHEAGHEAGVQRTDVAQRCPGGLGTCGDLNLSANRSHCGPPFESTVGVAARPYLEKIAAAWRGRTKTAWHGTLSGPATVAAARRPRAERHRARPSRCAPVPTS